MKVLLIWPPGIEKFNALPISLGYLISNIDRNRHEVEVFDCVLNGITSNLVQLKEYLLKYRPEIVGVSSWSVNYCHSLAILRLVKKCDHNVITVIGGPHPTTYPDMTIENRDIDFVFCGEAEISFNRFLDEIEKEKPILSSISGLVYRDKKIIRNKVNAEENLDKIKMPDYNIINYDKYIHSGYRLFSYKKRNAPIWLTRGCPYRCTFCAAPILNGRKIRKHSIDYAINWVKYLYLKKYVRHINIIDDNFTFDVKYAKEFCKEIIGLGFKNLQISTPNGIRVQKTDFELFSLMKNAGWKSIHIAPESGSIRILKLMKKDIDLDMIKSKVKQIKKAKLKVRGFFIIGYPGETIEDVNDTEKLIKECNFNALTISNFQPLPGTPVYDMLIKENKISGRTLPKNYSTGERAYTPENMKNFNFSKFFIRMNIYCMFRNPLNMIAIFRQYNKKQIFKRFVTNIRKILITS